ncbi:hypothetical protein FQN54_000379 [Arachnomyces sp. PD_36]|nr:hypothetical protein FQN54_000379 [Arachnomyces sp. PD_36]
MSKQVNGNIDLVEFRKTFEPMYFGLSASDSPRQVNGDISLDINRKLFTPVNLKQTWQKRSSSFVRSIDSNFSRLQSSDHSEPTDLETLKYLSTDTKVGDSLLGPRSESNPTLQYQYEQLQGSEELRVLKLLPGSSFDPLCCALMRANIDSIKAYDAISYSWGPKTDYINIECEGKLLWVPRSLGDALRQFRHPSHERILWADAICINQDDDNEKSQQIRLMRDIFKRARTVLIWLGNEDAHYAESVFELSRRIFRKDVTSIPPLHAPVWRGIQVLFSKSWFWRLWCFQEVALAVSADVLWGDARVSWECIGYTAAWIRHTGYELLRRLSLLGVYNASLMFSISNGAEHPPKEPFLHLMMLTRQFGASDSRDRVYALLGIPTTDADPDNHEFFHEPNCSIDKYSLYELLAHKFLENSEDLAFLSAVQHGPKVIAEPRSWIPQWDRRFTRTIMPVGLSARKFMASDHLEKRALKLEGSTLIVQGLEFDTVTCFSDILPTRDKLQGTMWQILNLWTHMVAPLQSHSTGFNLTNAFCWTLTAGKDWYGEPVVDNTSHLSDFVAFLRQHFDPEILKTSGLVQNLSSQLDIPQCDGEYAAGDPDRFLEALYSACCWRRFFVTKRGYIGIGPACMQQDDMVCVLSSGCVPFILRPSAQNFQLIGEAYVHGIMYGEACHQSEKETELRLFYLD